jgi:hypothetical protein
MKSHIFSGVRTQDNIDAVKYYGLLGQEDFIDNESNPRITNEEDARVVAKAIRNKKPKHFNDTNIHYRYYIKINPNLEIFNPIEYHSAIKDKKLYSFVNDVCKNSERWSFKEVDKSIFNQYVLFLKTKNIQSLREIERQLK